MSRITDTFRRLRDGNERGFVPFITAGDPDLETSLEIMLELAECGADVIEVGVPFSDPMADGPVIQRSSARALAGGTTLSDVMDLCRQFRMRSQTAVVLFTYFNPVHAMGLEQFCDTASDAGIDGVLLTDVVDEEAALMSRLLAERSVDLISLVAPTTADERLENICVNARGFIYAVARAGVTGTRERMTTDAEQLVARARRFTDLPIAVGFGISSADQIAEVWRFADAAVVGSAIVGEIEQAGIGDNVVGRVNGFVRRLMPEFANPEAKT